MSVSTTTLTPTQTNFSYNFYPTWIPSSDDWNTMFSGKVDAVNGWLTNPTVLGAMTLSNPPSATTDAANKAYVDGKLSGSTIPDAPSDGTPYCRLNHSWVPAPTTVTASVVGDFLVPGNLTVGLNTVLTGNVQLGSVSNGAYKLDVNGNFNVMGSGRFVTDGSTTWLTVTANPTTVAATAGTLLQLISNDGVASRLLMDTFGQVSQIAHRASGGIAAAPTALAANANIGSDVFLGHDGTAYSPTAASFVCRADTAWTPTNHGTQMAWQTTASGTTVNTERMRLQASGNLTLGSGSGVALTDNGYRLDINGGNARIDSGVGLVSSALRTGFALTVAGPDATPTATAMIGYGASATLNFYSTGGTRAVPATLASAAVIGAVGALGYGGSIFSANPTGAIQFVTEEAWTSVAMGTAIAFRTTPNTTIATVEAMRLTNNGCLVINTPNNVAGAAGYRLDVTGAARIDNYPGGGWASQMTPATGPGLTLAAGDGTGPRFALFSFGASGGFVTGYAALGTRAAPTALALNSALLIMNAQGYGATAWCAAPRAQFSLIAGEAWSDTAQGTAMTFRVTANTTILTTEAMRIQPSGNLTIGIQTDAGYKLQVNGTINATGNFLLGGGTVGPAGNPGGTVVVGTSAPLIVNYAVQLVTYPPAQTSATLWVMSATAAILAMDSFANNPSAIRFRTASGAQSAIVALPINVQIGSLQYQGYDGTVYSTAAAVNVVYSDAAWSATSHPTRFSWFTTPAASITLAETMRLTSAGDLLIGLTTDAGFRLDVAGTARISGTTTLGTVNAGPVFVNSGALVVGSDTTAQQLWIDGPAGSLRLIMFQTASLSRFRLNLNSTAEAGSNAGSDLDLITYNDAGAANPATPIMRVIRATGNFLFGQVTDAGFKIDVFGTARITGLLSLSAGLTVTAGSVTVPAGTLTTGSNTAAFAVIINGPAGQGRNLRFQTAGLQRWSIYANASAEGGANVGSDLDILSYADDGATLIANPAIRITRATGLVTANNGLSLASTLGASVTDLSHGLAVFGTTFGLNATTNRINVVAPSTGAVVDVINGVDIMSVASTGVRVIGNAGFYNTAPIAKQTVTGAWAGSTAGKALATALAALGLITDSTTA